MPKVSVIIPVYNVEKYLKECLDSVINQTLEDIEIICINDGSTDNSSAILEEYAKKDNRIRVINQTNQGVSSARNIGIKNTKSDFIIFLDADDWLDKNTVENTYHIISNSNYDILCFGYCVINENKNQTKTMTVNLRKAKNAENISRSLFNIFLNSSISKIYRTDFIKNNNIYFPKDIVVSEDGVFNLLCLYKGAKFGYEDNIYYHYRYNRKDSASSARISSLKEEILSDKFLLNTQEFKNLTDENLILLSFEKIINNIIYYYNRPNSRKYHLIYDYQIQQFTKFLYKKYDCNLLNKCENIHILKDFNVYKYLFSMAISKDKKHKILTILGIKIKLRRKITNNSNYTEIPIVFSCDNNYIAHLCSTMASILINKNDNVIPYFYILNDGISTKNKKRIESLKKLSSFKYKYILVNKNQFSNAPMTVKHISLSTYYRYVIAEVLDECDKVIYLDCDLNVLSDLTELYNTDIDNYYIAGVIDILHEDNTERLNLEKYINAGVLLLNLKKIRQDNITKKLFNYTKENIDIIKWQDQDVINVVMQNGIMYIDKKWNAQVGAYKACYTSGFNTIGETANIVHYIGFDKPWLLYSNNPFKHIYWKYLSYTPYKHMKIQYSLKYLKDNIFSIKKNEE